MNKTSLLIYVSLVVGLLAAYSEPSGWDAKVDHLAPLPSVGNHLEQPKNKDLFIGEDMGSPSLLQGDSVITENLRGIVLINSPKALQPEGISGVQGLRSDGLAPPRLKLLESVLEPLWGEPLTLSGGTDVAQLIGRHYRENDYPLVYVVLPPGQKIKNDTLQIVVVEGVIGDISVSGNTYSSSEQIISQMNQKSGDRMRLSLLRQDLGWLTNDYRKVDFVVERGQEAQSADLGIRLEEVKPWEVYVGFSDTGNKLTGKERYNMGVTYGNLWELDHRVGYQYTQGERANDFFSHFFTYKAPLHGWKHTFSAFFSYAETLSRINSSGLISRTHGDNTQIGLRYSIPLNKQRMVEDKLDIGFDYKRSDSTFDYNFFGTPIPVSPIATQTLQFVLGLERYEAIAKDKSNYPGSYTLAANLYLSPGGMASDNDKASFAAAKTDADPRYLYVTAYANRLFLLGNNWMLNLKASFQYSPETLLSGEQFNLTGDGYVRGYDYGEGGGDYGYMGSVELWSPSVSIFDRLGLAMDTNDRTQAYVFGDHGYAGLQNPNGSDPNVEATSAGVGLRLSYSDYAQFKFEYGWQLRDTGSSSLSYDKDNSRAHMSIRLIY